MQQQSKLLLVVYNAATINIIACDLYFGNNQNYCLWYIFRQQSKLLLVFYNAATVNIFAYDLYFGNNQYYCL